MFVYRLFMFVYSVCCNLLVILFFSFFFFFITFQCECFIQAHVYVPFDLICSQGEEVEAKRSKVSIPQVQHLLTLNQTLLATTLFSI